MLSRSNSNGADRLRRAKSTSSAHTSSSGHQRTPTSIDPFVTRQQAEAAAVEAYHRARQYQEPQLQPYRAVPPKLQRRRSQVTGKTEGSHFEDARLGRRRSNSRRDDEVTAKPAGTQQQKRAAIPSNDNEEERIITRRRSVIPPDPGLHLRSYDQSSSLRSSARYGRKSQSGYSEGSPVRRNSALKERQSTLQLRASRSDRNDGYGGNLAHLSDFRGSEEVTVQSVQTKSEATQEVHTDADDLAMARDKYLRDFQQSKKLRERKSFILAPFQKRRATNLNNSSDGSYDTSLPPFNYADEALPPPLPPALTVVPAITIHAEQKPRNFSSSLKGRIKRVFRKSSRSTSGLPLQHVEGKSYFFSTTSPLSTPVIDSAKDEDPFVTATNETRLAVPEFQAGSASGRRSAGAQSEAKSRVTSWADSTVAGTCSTRHDTDHEQSVGEQGQLKRSDSMSTLRKASSFLGRPVFNKLRKASKAELRSSDESTGLYSALQERINPAEVTNQTLKEEPDPQSTRSSARATLPSQQQPRSSISSRTHWPAPTIRSVTPDPGAYKLDIPSPVTEVLSPEADHPHESSRSQRHSQQPNPTSQGHSHRRQAIKAPTPSKDQLALRMEKSNNRWRGPLDELSPAEPRSTKATMMDDNPYELRSLSRSLQQPVVTSDLPHHTRVSQAPVTARHDVLSPSLYSRGTDEASPRPDTPVDQGGTMVTITGREVRSYSISPSKRRIEPQQPSYGSQDWRRWLSGEMHGWDGLTADEDVQLPKGILKNAEPIEVETNTARDSAKLRDGSTSPASGASALEAKTRRPQVKSRRSSYMNERYPMIECAPSLSTQSDRVYDDHLRPESYSDNKTTDTHTRHRGVSRHQSVAHLDRAARRSSALVNEETAEGSGRSGGVKQGIVVRSGIATSAVGVKAKPSSRPKSALDLYANYKSSTIEQARPIEVRRKSQQDGGSFNILEDTTIQNISAGPYASQQAMSNVADDTNKENAPPAELGALPMLSSSEWLSAGTNKSTNAKKMSRAQSTDKNRNASVYSTSKREDVEPSGGSSPGQRLATNWLDGRKSKENSPAFV